MFPAPFLNHWLCCHQGTLTVVENLLPCKKTHSVWRLADFHAGKICLPLYHLLFGGTKSLQVRVSVKFEDSYQVRPLCVFPSRHPAFSPSSCDLVPLWHPGILPSLTRGGVWIWLQPSGRFGIHPICISACITLNFLWSGCSKFIQFMQANYSHCFLINFFYYLLQV